MNERVKKDPFGFCSVNVHLSFSCTMLNMFMLYNVLLLGYIFRRIPLSTRIYFVPSPRACWLQERRSLCRLGSELKPQHFQATLSKSQRKRVI